jgi:hypothetical protein
MQFTGDYPSNPPGMLRDLFKINLVKTMKKKYGTAMRQAFATFADYLPIGSQAPYFTLETIAGEKLSLAGLRGKVVVLEFGALT